MYQPEGSVLVLHFLLCLLGAIFWIFKLDSNVRKERFIGGQCLLQCSCVLSLYPFLLSYGCVTVSVSAPEWLSATNLYQILTHLNNAFRTSDSISYILMWNCVIYFGVQFLPDWHSKSFMWEWPCNLLPDDLFTNHGTFIVFHTSSLTTVTSSNWSTQT